MPDAIKQILNFIRQHLIYLTEEELQRLKLLLVEEINEQLEVRHGQSSRTLSGW